MQGDGEPPCIPIWGKFTKCRSGMATATVRKKSLLPFTVSDRHRVRATGHVSVAGTGTVDFRKNQRRCLEKIGREARRSHPPVSRVSRRIEPCKDFGKQRGEASFGLGRNQPNDWPAPPVPDRSHPKVPQPRMLRQRRLVRSVRIRPEQHLLLNRIMAPERMRYRLPA
jgi:hypothetical protein